MKIINYIFILLFISSIYSQINLNKRKEIIKESFNPRVLTFSNRFFLIHAYNENTLYLMGGEKMKIFSARGLGIITALISENEDYVIISNYHNTIDIHPLNNSLKEKKIEIGNAIAFALDLKSENLYAGLSNGEILVSNLNNNKEFRFVAHKDIIRDVKVINNLLVSISHDGFVKIWNIDNNFNLVKTIKIDKVLTKIAVTKDSKVIAIACFDGSIFILDSEFSVTKELKPHQLLITQVKFQDNNTIISSSFDKRIISTDIQKEIYSHLYLANDYITNFDMKKNKFIYSSRDGKIYYYNASLAD